MSGFFEPGLAGTAATWSAALVTLAVWSYLVGERRILRVAQLLLAGLATGYLGLLAIREVLVPQLVDPLLATPSAHPELWIDLLLVCGLLVATWLPRRLAVAPAAILVGGTAGFALGGAVTGTLLPQLAAGVVTVNSGSGGAVSGVVALLITVPVLLSFLHGTTRSRLVGGVGRLGRWLLIAGLGAWLGFLIVSRLALFVDRVGFLLGDWLGLVR